MLAVGRRLGCLIGKPDEFKKERWITTCLNDALLGHFTAVVMDTQFHARLRFSFRRKSMEGARSNVMEEGYKYGWMSAVETLARKCRNEWMEARSQTS